MGNVTDVDNCIEWIVKDNLLQQFKSATHGKKFVSPSFRTNDDTLWKISFDSNGYTKSEKDNCCLYLKLHKLSANKKQIGVNCLLEVGEANWKGQFGYTFKKNGERWGITNAFKKS
eukprot:6042_1